MRCNGRRYVGLLTLSALVLAAAGCGLMGRGAAGAGSGELPAGLTVERDTWGVPSITAPDDAGLSFGLAYAMAEDGMPVLQNLYGAAIGNAGAEPGAPASGLDTVQAQARSARADYAAMTPAQQAVCAAFAEGLNHYLRAHPAEVREIVTFEPWMVVAFASDVLATDRAPQVSDAQRAGETMVWVVAGDTSPPLLLASGREDHPYEMELRRADGWRFRGHGILGLAQPMEGHNAQLAYAHARNAQVSSETARSGGSWLAQLHAMARATDTATFIAAWSSGPMHTATAMVDASNALLFAAAGGHRSIRNGSDGYAGDRTAAADAVLRPASQWTMDALVAAAFDRRVYGADADIAALIDEWEQAGARNPDRAAGADAAIELLRDWARVSRGGSEVMTLYAAYRRAYERDSTGALPRFRALESTIATPGLLPLRPWEAVNHIVSASVPGDSTVLAVPVAGAPARFGIMFAYDAERTGQHYVRVAEGGTGVGASVVSRGQSARPVSRHSFDQAALFSTARLKATVVTR